MKFRRFLFLAIIALSIFSCNRPIRYDLIVENASIFDTKTGDVLAGQTILVMGDSIVGIISSNIPVRTKKVVDADGRLVTPGNIDTHISFEKAIYSTHKNADNHPKILTNFYRNKYSKNFLPYGVTTTLEMTKDLNWADQMLKWKQNPKFCDIIVAFNISEIDQPKNRIEISMSDLSSMGIKHLYINNDKNTELVNNILQIAPGEKMDVFVKPLNTFTDIVNIENIEYIYIPIINVVEKTGDKNSLLKQIKNVYGNTALPEEIYALEAFKYTVENNPELLDTIANKLSKQSVSISTKLTAMAQYTDICHVKPTANTQLSLNKELKHRITYSFNHFLSFIKRIHDVGATLRIGTNCEDGGISFISEQLLLTEAGISASDVIKISTINAAKVLKIDNRYGSIEVGKKADLIIYDQNPLDDPKNFASTRRVIKGGRLYKRNSTKIEIEE